MTEQDDLNKDELDKKYKAVSTEQPDKQLDHFIMQAAADAVAPDAPLMPKAKDNFSSRRWHMPVSIAAAAVITVSVVTSLKPWVISVPESSEPMMEVYEDADIDNSSPQYEKLNVNAAAESEQFTRRKQSESKRQTQRTILAEKEQQLQTTDSSQLIAPVISLNAEAASSFAKKLKKDQDQPNINQALTAIEQLIAADNITTADAQLKQLLEVNNVENLSSEQQQRIKIIQLNLTSTSIHQ